MQVRFSLPLVVMLYLTTALGAYTHSAGIPFIRENVAQFLKARYVVSALVSPRVILMFYAQ